MKFGLLARMTQMILNSSNFQAVFISKKIYSEMSDSGVNVTVFPFHLCPRSTPDRNISQSDT